MEKQELLFITILLLVVTDLTVKGAVLCTIYIYSFGAFILNSVSIYNTQKHRLSVYATLNFNN